MPDFVNGPRFDEANMDWEDLKNDPRATLAQRLAAPERNQPHGTETTPSGNLRVNIELPPEAKEQLSRLDSIFTTIGTVFEDQGRPPTPEEIIAALVRGIDEMRQDCHRILRMSLSEEAVNAIMEGVYR